LTSTRADHELLDVGLQQRREVDVAGVLAGDDDGVEPHRRVPVVLDGDLRLPVRAQVRDGAVLAHRCEPAGEPVRQHDRQRHQLGGVVGRVTEHQSLVAGALPVQRVLAAFGALLERVVHALRDVRRLRADRHGHAARLAVEALLRGVVADLEDLVPDDGRDVGVGLGRHLARHVHQAGGDECLDGDAAADVLLEERVEHGVADLVGDLVRVALGDRLGREEASRHEGLLAGRGDWLGAEPCAGSLAVPPVEPPPE